MNTKELAKNFVDIKGRRMAYAEMGEGDPIVFLHGNPTSSYLWRNVMPHLQGVGRCIAPDLIGMGESEKLLESGPGRYSFQEHRDYLWPLLDAVGVTENVTLVVHDWGGALGFDWARNHAGAVKAIAYMETIVRPLEWAEWNRDATPIFQGLRSPAGESMILEKNAFIERILPGSVLRELSEEEMAVYRRPFGEAGEGRRPTLTWPRQIPIDGEPPDVCDIVQASADWMAQNDLPKLFVNAEPGAILLGPLREFCRGWKNQREVTVAGSHFIQEDSPDEIGAAIKAWLTGIKPRTG